MRVLLNEKIARLEAYHRHPTIAAASRALGMNERVLHRWLDRSGYLVPTQTPRPFSTKELLLLKERLWANVPATKIAKELGRTPAVVRKYRSRFGIPGRKCHAWTPGQRRVVEQIVDAAIRQIAQRLALTETAASSAVTSASLSSAKRRKANSVVDLGAAPWNQKGPSKPLAARVKRAA